MEGVSSIAVDGVIWNAPKTDWTKDDKFNLEDYNRIKNNLVFLSKKARDVSVEIEIDDMGEDITSYSAYWEVSKFNAFETNLQKIINNTYKKDYGNKQTFYDNGIFIKYDELNRIEKAILDIYEDMLNHEKGLRKIPFVFGRFREVRI